MHICLTFDYELFFGENSGSAERCLLLPTERLRSIFRECGVGATFFVDASYLLVLKEDSVRNDISRLEWEKVRRQLTGLKKEGHELGLHIHPHWMDCFRSGAHWKMNTARYRLQQWEESIRNKHIRQACTLLREMEPGLVSFRAGGWCVQPFRQIKDVLRDVGIQIDSSVVPGMRVCSSHLMFDFVRAPLDIAFWRFSDDECTPDTNGGFTEIPVTPDHIPFWFQYKMFLLHRIRPSYYLPYGDGKWLKDVPSHYKKYFFSYNHYASTDGIFAYRLNEIYRKARWKNYPVMVTLGHPKSMANFSFDALHKFILMVRKEKGMFTTIRELNRKMIVGEFR